MNYGFRLLFVLFFLSGCKQEAAIEFTTSYFSEEELELCNNEPCSQVSIEYQVAKGDESIAAAINEKIEWYIIASLFLGDDEAPSAKTIPAAATEFILAYRDHQPDLPSNLDLGGYDAEVNIYHAFQNESIVSLEMYAYLFTGGAHGYGATSFLLFDLKTGEEMEARSLFTDLAGLEAYAERKFKEEHKISKDASINSTGFWFEEDQFYLPDAMGFSEDKFVLLFNPYEIASYAAGAIRLEILIEEITPYLNTEFL